MKLTVEIDLKTIIPLDNKGDAEVLALTKSIKENWFDFIQSNHQSFQVTTYCEMA